MKIKPDNALPKLSKGIYTIAGICKNSGKTTLLNTILAQIEGEKIGVLTTGRDGEAKDVLSNNPKPPVRILANTLFTSTSEVINKNSTAVEVLDKLHVNTGDKTLWLLKALREIEIEITGPASAASQIQTAELMQSYGAEIVFIDGSFDRKSIALNSSVKGIFLVVGSSYGNLDKIKSELARLVKLAQIPTINNSNHTWRDCISYRCSKTWQQTELTSVLGNSPELTKLLDDKKIIDLYIPGALTDSTYAVLKQALKQISKLIVRHPLNLQLNQHNISYLQTSLQLLCLNPFVISAIAVNSWSVDGIHMDSNVLRQSIREQYPTLTVIDIYEG